MDATQRQIDALRKLAHLDRERIQAQLALTKLPQQEQAARVRGKLEGVAVKIGKVQAMRDEATAQRQALRDEDAQLVERQDEVQAQIGEVQGDYRRVTALTRDLEGIAKRRETVQFEAGKLDERLSEVEAVLAQATAARDALAQQEADLAASYRQEGGALKAKADAALAARDGLLAELPGDVATDYERVLAKCGGVALAAIAGGACSACRSPIDADRMLQLRKEAPLSHCPSCGRLIVVGQGE